MIPDVVWQSLRDGVRPNNLDERRGVDAFPGCQWHKDRRGARSRPGAKIGTSSICAGAHQLHDRDDFIIRTLLFTSCEIPVLRDLNGQECGCLIGAMRGTLYTLDGRMVAEWQ